MSLRKGLRTILLKALAPQLQDRYQDIVDFIHDIANYLKSGEWEKDRPGRDQLKELVTAAAASQQLLLPQTTPDWPQLEMSLAQHLGSTPRGLYCDFYKLPNNTFAFFLAHSYSYGITTLTQIAILRGMVRTLIREREVSMQKPLDILELTSELNHLMLGETGKEPCSLQILVLDPLMEQMRYLSCGTSTLLHVPSETREPRYLHAENPLLGTDERIDYMEMVDNWSIGDLVLLHSLDPFASLHAPEEEKQLFSDLVKAHIALATPRQAEAILKKTTPHLAPEQRKVPHVLLELQRLL